jgi:hypothetical protein
MLDIPKSDITAEGPIAALHLRAIWVDRELPVNGPAA